ncbi:MAG: helix-turn-helix domain-containing protein [Paludisphaera borealis]|uniref:helix-turn-helix domain-containing protein n=1 Tax=Paludisphaera borealis TaxID=1387353 RepID=UPI00284DCCBD|nr:helix-turn-helix domain-containing protein [Paludisphaera borealis]MDR3621565.1 helix-turn-helix domain-containing protein [Paludisphaera borealis]
MKHLTVPQAAERLGLSKTAVYQLCSRDKPAIRHLRLGAGRVMIRIPTEAIDEYLEAAMVTPLEREERRPDPPLRCIRDRR